MVMAYLKRPATAAIVLAGAAGGPYMLYETDVGDVARQSAGYFVGSSEVVSPDIATPVANSNPLNKPSNDLLLSQPPIFALQEVVRFDINPAWVTSRFPQVSTVVGDLQLDGLRVPLVTGTTPTDLAGTLTYYFDRYQRLQRISLHCVTGDPTRFAVELQRSYQLQRQAALGGALYLRSWKGSPACVMHTAPVTMIRADAPYSRFNLFLEVNRPDQNYGLSSEARDLLASAQMYPPR